MSNGYDFKYPNPAWQLSLLEVRELARRSLDGVIDGRHLEIEKGSFNRKTGYYSPEYLALCKSIHGSLRQEETLMDPEVFAELRNGGWNIRYNEPLYRQVTGLLAQLEGATDGQRSVQVFTTAIRRSIEWKKGVQLDVATLVCPLQQPYIESGDVLKRNPISALAVADYIGVDKSTLSRVNSGFVIEANGEVPRKAFYALDLMPGNRNEKHRLPVMLNDLMQSPSVFFDGGWVMSSADMAELIEQKYGVRYNQKTISNYKARISTKNLKTKGAQHSAN